jgi:hypothetical protein
MNPMKTLISIVNYNGKKLLEKNIPYLKESKGVDFDICVVDNNSLDDSIQFLKEKHPDVKIVESKQNLGYGRAHNLVVEKYSNYDYYVFINNDIRVTTNWLTELVKVAKNNKNVGAVGPKIFLSDKEKKLINSAGMNIDKHHMGYDRYVGEVDSDEKDVIEKVDGICGAVMLIPKEVINKVKGFHPKMFLYYEDVDLSLRIRDAGYKIYYCGSSVVYHDHMASTKSMGSFKRNWMNMKNRYVSIKGRLGFIVAIKETVWYLYNWIIWKLFHSKRLTLKEYLDDK